MLIVLTTTPNIKEAEALASQLLEEKLAACVQVLPPMTSFYFWKGEIQKETEHLVLVKTLEEKFDALQAFIQKNHSYEVPEIVAIKAEHVSDSYLAWMREYLV